MVRAVAISFWNCLPRPGRGRFGTFGSAMGSVVPWLSLSSLSHGSRSWEWFSSGSEEKYEQKDSLSRKSVGSEKENEDQEEETFVRSHVNF